MIILQRMWNRLVSSAQSLTEKPKLSVTVPELGRGEYQREIER